MKLTITQFLIQGYPESLALAALAIAIAGQKLMFRDVLLVGTLQAVTALVVRSLPITFGIHTLILLTLLTFYLNTVLKIPILACFRGALVSLICLGVFEMLFLGSIASIMGLKMGDIASAPLLLTFLALPQVGATIALGLIIDYIRFKKGGRMTDAGGS
ncbi:MAG: hypothetical protein H5U03_05500 [Clostridia bacterium]|nr:hypothetical protein [Clostridia bacterium]